MREIKLEQLGNLYAYAKKVNKQELLQRIEIQNLNLAKILKEVEK